MNLQTVCRFWAAWMLVAITCCQAFVGRPYVTHQSTRWMPLNANVFGENGSLGKIFGNNEAGPKTVFEIPAEDVKIGGLRFLLQIHLVGEQHKPERNSWFIKLGDDAGDLQIYFQDGTGMCSIEIHEYSIKVMRHGERPSLRYILQESVLLHGILDEIDNVAFGMEDIDVEKRLLKLVDDGAIAKAREKLPARKE